VVFGRVGRFLFVWRIFGYFGEPENDLYDQKTSFAYPPVDTPPGFAVTVFFSFLSSESQNKACVNLSIPT